MKESDNNRAPVFLVLRFEFDRAGFIEWIEEFQLIDRRKFLVGLRGKIVPDVTGFRVRPERASGVGLDLGQWITLVVRQKIVLEKIRFHHRCAEPGFSLARMRIDIRRRLFARMTGGTTLCENFLSPRHDCLNRS